MPLSADIGIAYGRGRSAGNTAVATFGGLLAGRYWLYIGLELKRAAADREEARKRQTADQDAYRRWLRKLEDRPADGEMAAWLDCDAHRNPVDTAHRMGQMLAYRTYLGAVAPRPR